jgi:hypothetical protein
MGETHQGPFLRSSFKADPRIGGTKPGTAPFASSGKPKKKKKKRPSAAPKTMQNSPFRRAIQTSPIGKAKPRSMSGPGRKRKFNPKAGREK